MFRLIAAPYHTPRGQNKHVGAGPPTVLAAGIAQKLKLPAIRLDVGPHCGWREVNAALTSPGVNLHGAGGLKPRELFDAVAFTFQRYEPVALAITNYNPERDPDGRTLNMVIQLIENIVRLRRTAASR